MYFIFENSRTLCCSCLPTSPLVTSLCNTVRLTCADIVHFTHYGKFIDPPESCLFANPKSTAM